jgi:hypothetical protein
MKKEDSVETIRDGFSKEKQDIVRSSREREEASRNDLPTRICLVCGNKILGVGKKYCSKKCNGEDFKGNKNNSKSAVVRDKISKKLKGRKNTWIIGDLNPSKRPEVIEKIKNNPNVQKSWFKKGHKETKEQYDKRVNNLRKITCGDGNPMRNIDIKKRAIDTLKNSDKWKKWLQSERRSIISSNSALKRLHSKNCKYYDTDIEIITEQELIRRKLVLNVDYFKQSYIIRLLDDSYIVSPVKIEGGKIVMETDFFLPRWNSVIECDGCFPHGCSIHNPNWSVDRDKRKDERLKNYKVFHFKGCEIKENISLLIDKVLV